MAKKKYVEWYNPQQAIGKIIFRKDSPNDLFTIIFADSIFVGIMIMDKYGCQSFTYTYKHLLENYMYLGPNDIPVPCGKEVIEQPAYR